MAISFKSDKDYGYGLLPLFGVSSSVINEAKGYGITVAQSTPGTFLIRWNDVVYGSITVKGTAITLAKSNTLGPASKEALRFQFEAAIGKALAAAKAASGFKGPSNNGVTETPWPFDAQNMKVIKTPTFDGMPLLKPALKPALKPVVAQKIGKFSKASPVDLQNATEVYQAVNGTTQGSVYFVLALFDGLKIAARISGQKLSIRACGSKLMAYENALEDMSMDMKASYSSGHYDVSSPGLMIKTLGALVGRVGFGSVQGLADLNTFVGGQQ